MARILIVDDERLVARSLAAQLRRLGHEPVALAHDGREAVEKAGTHNPDLILMDYAMPGMNGADAASKIWSTRGIPSLMISAFAEGTPVDASAEAGAIGYLVKPVSASNLRPAIDIALRRAADLRSAGTRADELERQLRERKVIERAKGLLMERRQLSEEDAYRHLQRESRNQRRRLADLAQSVLASEGLRA